VRYLLVVALATLIVLSGCQGGGDTIRMTTGDVSGLNAPAPPEPDFETLDEQRLIELGVPIYPGSVQEEELPAVVRVTSPDGAETLSSRRFTNDSPSRVIKFYEKEIRHESLLENNELRMATITGRNKLGEDIVITAREEGGKTAISIVVTKSHGHSHEPGEDPGHSH
jgi:hypothetical protein